MFLLSTTSHKAHDSNLYVSVLFGENQQCTANDLLMSYIVRLFGSWDPTIDRNGSEDNITSAKGHHVCLIILLLQSSFMMRMNLLCVRTFSLCNMSRAVLSVPYFSGTPIVVTAINTGGKLPAKPNSATLPAYLLTNFQLSYHTSYRPIRFIPRSLSEYRIQRVLAASPNPLSKSDVSNLLKGHRGRLLTSSFMR
jgi:hypothetical protein